MKRVKVAREAPIRPKKTKTVSVVVKSKRNKPINEQNEESSSSTDEQISAATVKTKNERLRKAKKHQCKVCDKIFQGTQG